jgi:hypothetical protein
MFDTAGGFEEADEEGGLDGLDLSGGFAEEGAAKLDLGGVRDADVEGGGDGADEVRLAFEFFGFVGHGMLVFVENLKVES